MSRSFVDDDYGYDASPRVYVNNMNTPHATVTLPERRPNKRTFMRGNEGSRRNDESNTGASYTGSHVHFDKSSLAAGGGGGVGAPVTSSEGSGAARSGLRLKSDLANANGDVVHPNLQNIYSRIMRRLKRQMNYAELARTSLAEQYGVDLELQCEEEAAAAAGKQHHIDDHGQGEDRTSGCTTGSQMALSSLQTSSPAQADTELDGFGEDSSGSSSRRPFIPVSRTPPPRRESNSLENTSDITGATEPFTSQRKELSRGAGGGTSQLLQFKQQPLPAAGIRTSPFEDANSGCGKTEADVEREMAEQPCPHPLRLVVRHVLDTLEKKMMLAENGSLRDCIIFSFESRALLDRLLSEIPIYSQYAAYANTTTGDRGSQNSLAAQQAMSGLYHQLRKRPVLLPRGEYVEAATGAIRAELIAAGAQPSFGGTSNHLPNISTQASANTNNSDVDSMSYKVLLQTQLPEVALPAGYGKSSRRVAAMAHENNSSTLIGESSQRTSRPPLLRDHLPSVNGPAFLPTTESAGDASEMMTSSFGDKMSGIGVGNARYTSEGSGYFSSEALAAQRATKRVSAGTITDDNAATTVSQSAYDALQLRVEELQAQLAEAQQHRNALAEQLCEEEGYTDQKKRIVQYLRETLLRECNMLRTRLHHATSVPSIPSGGKGISPQRSGGMSSVGLYKESSTIPSGSSGSTHNYARQLKQSAGAILSSSASMGISVPLQQRHSSYDRPGDSETLGSVHGANASTAAGGGGQSVNRTSPKLRLTVIGASNNNNTNACSGGGGGNSGSRNSPGHPAPLASTRGDAFQAEFDAVHSLLDLALLAVEEEAVLPRHAAQQLQSGHGDKDVLRSGFRKNAKQQLDELRVSFEERQQALKKTLLQQTAEHNYVVEEQKSEMERLRSLTDLSRVREILQESVTALRAELNQLRMHVAEQLHFFKAVQHNTAQSLLHRAALVDSTMLDNVALSSTLNATRELIESANALFLPMLTREYECGYHPWPLKVRNTRDPLSHIIQLRFGPAEVVRLRDSLNELGKLYVAVHQYVMNHAVLPESARPVTGKPLEVLCAALALNPTSYTETVFAARRCHDVEGQLRKKLARLQSRILWNAYLQRIYMERSVAALAEAGIDPRTATLPVARRIDILAQQRGDLLQARVKTQRERSENAKELYRLWRAKEIDIMEGYPTPQTQRNQLALLSSNSTVNGEEGSPVAKLNSKSARFSLFLKRNSTLGSSSNTGSGSF